ncbi:MAG TPA: ribosome maturation factor RimP [Acidimicrobiales bacterium]|nr:ribosome maturation factor RimP [Acidimicrobiales bacterium]
MGPADAIRDLAAPLLAAAGLELWDVEVTRDAVRVMVDRAGGVDLDALAEATAVLSPLFDDNPELTPDGRFELEVSSPGVERTLRTLEQLQRYLGQLVAVKTTESVAGARRWQGTLVAADEQALTVAPEDAPADAPTVEIPRALVQRTRTVLVWGPAPKPGQKRTEARA